MATCIKCGAQLLEGAAFCNHCGTSQIQQNMQMTQQAPQPQMTQQAPQPQMQQQAPQYAQQPQMQPAQQPYPQQQYVPQQYAEQAGGKKSRKGLVIGLISGGVALVAGLVVLVLFLTGVIGGGGSTTAGGATGNTATTADTATTANSATTNVIDPSKQDYVIDFVYYRLTLPAEWQEHIDEPVTDPILWGPQHETLIISAKDDDCSLSLYCVTDDAIFYAVEGEDRELLGVLTLPTGFPMYLVADTSFLQGTEDGYWIFEHRQELYDSIEAVNGCSWEPGVIYTGAPLIDCSDVRGQWFSQENSSVSLYIEATGFYETYDEDTGDLLEEGYLVPQGNGEYRMYRIVRGESNGDFGELANITLVKTAEDSLSITEGGITTVFVSADGYEGGSAYKKGDIIVFGSYEQDGNTANGKEPIEWEVLDTEGDRVFVVSKYILDLKLYDDGNSDAVEHPGTWEASTLRKWLNHDFYEEAFTAPEQEQIIETLVINKDNPLRNESNSTIFTNEVDTYDKVFLLSTDEVYRYYEFNMTERETKDYLEKRDKNGIPLDWDGDVWRASEALMIDGTDYVHSLQWGEARLITEEQYEKLKTFGYSEECIGKPGKIWWLRNPGGIFEFKGAVSADGFVGHLFYTALLNECLGVRPAMWLNP